MIVLPSRRVRRFLVAALAAVPVSVALAPVASADDVAPGSTVVGTVVHAYVEHRDQQDAGAQSDFGAPLTYVKSGSGDPVRVPTASLRDVPVGATVKVTVGGDVQDAPARADQLDPAKQVLAASVVAPAPAAATPAATDTVSIAMVTPSGTVRDATSLASVVSQVSGPVAQFWAAQSNGAIQLAVGDTHDWGTTTAHEDCSDPEALWSDVAQQIGFTPGAGKHLLLYLPANSPGCAYGLAEVGSSLHAGGYLYVQATGTSVIAHELGHNFGLEHSGREECQGTVETGTCTTFEYGDYYDVMGASWDQVGSLNAAQSARLGLLPAADVQAVTVSTAPASYALAPLSATSGTRAVRLTGTDGRVYYLEYRAASGQDAYLGDPSADWLGLRSGVLVHRVETQSPADSSTLLDGTPTAGTGYSQDADSVLAVGSTLRLDGGEFQVTLRSVSGTAASVDVAPVAGDPACASRRSASTTGVALLSTGGTTQALVDGTDGALWYRPIDGGTSTWRSLGGQIRYGPAAVVAGSTSYAFVVGLDGTLFYRSDGGSGWSPWRTLGGYLTASPAAAALPDGTVRVFGRGSDGTLWSRELRSGVWGAWTSLGGYLSSPPTATTDADGVHVDVLVRGTDGFVFAQSLAEGQATGTYQRRQVATCSALALPSAQSAGDPATGAFLDSAGAPRLLETASSPSLGGQLTSTPAVEFSGSAFVVAGRGADGALWFYDGRSGGTGWVWLGGGIR